MQRVLDDDLHQEKIRHGLFYGTVFVYLCFCHHPLVLRIQFYLSLSDIFSIAYNSKRGIQQIFLVIFTRFNEIHIKYIIYDIF